MSNIHFAIKPEPTVYHVLPIEQATALEVQLAAKFIGLDEDMRYADMIMSWLPLDNRQVKALMKAIINQGYSSIIVNPKDRLIKARALYDFNVAEPVNVYLKKNQVGVLISYPKDENFEASTIVFTKSGDNVLVTHPGNREQILIKPLKAGAKSVRGEDGSSLDVERHHTHAAYIIDKGRNMGAASLNGGAMWAFDEAVDLYWLW